MHKIPPKKYLDRNMFLNISALTELPLNQTHIYAPESCALVLKQIYKNGCDNKAVESFQIGC